LFIATAWTRAYRCDRTGAMEFPQFALNDVLSKLRDGPTPSNTRHGWVRKA